MISINDVKISWRNTKNKMRRFRKEFGSMNDRCSGHFFHFVKAGNKKFRKTKGKTIRCAIESASRAREKMSRHGEYVNEVNRRFNRSRYNAETVNCSLLGSRGAF